MMRPLNQRRENLVGMTYTTVSITDLECKHPSVEVNCLVDTGALNCLLPSALLYKIGARPEGSRVYELADGSKMEFSYCWVRLHVMGEDVFARVLFGPDDVEAILGVIALESAGLAVDPVTRTLKRLQVEYLKRVA